MPWLLAGWLEVLTRVCVAYFPILSEAEGSAPIYRLADASYLSIKRREGNWGIFDQVGNDEL